MSLEKQTPSSYNPEQPTTPEAPEIEASLALSAIGARLEWIRQQPDVEM